MSNVYDHATLQVTRLADAALSDPHNRLPMFSTQDPLTPNYVRNPANWCRVLDLSCISPWNSRGGIMRGGCLVTSRHMLCAAHYPILTGDTVAFVPMTSSLEYNHGVVIHRKVSHHWQHLNSDLALVRFDAEVPSIIEPACVLPVTWKHYIRPATPSTASMITQPAPGLPVLQTDSQERLRYCELYSINMSYKSVATRSYENIERKQYKVLTPGTTRWASGESGSPLFMVIRNRLVLLTCARTSGSGPAVHEYINFINSQFAGWGDMHRLAQIDLTSFSRL